MISGVTEIELGWYMDEFASTLDDLLRSAFEALLKSPNIVQATRGRNRELTGAVLRLRNPRARLSHTDKKGKIFSGLGELLWYLARTDDASYITYYIKAYEDDAVAGRIHGAYGPRIFAMRGAHDQFGNVLALLRNRGSSRKAVIQLLNAEDVAENHPEIPCTCSFQFMMRNERLQLVTYMRSNDAFLGLPHDIFAFTMLQEIMARKLGVEPGEYTHMVGSLHLYEENEGDARQYVDEGWQPQVSAAMPPMPDGDPDRAIQSVLRAEVDIREGKPTEAGELGLDPYWADLVRLLQIYRHMKNGQGQEISALHAKMSTTVYDEYISRAANRSEGRPQ